MKTSGHGGVSVFLGFFFGAWIAAVIKALPLTTYNRNSKFKWHNEQIYAIQCWCH